MRDIIAAGAIGLALSAALPAAAQQEMVEHPMLSRYPGSEVMGTPSVREFDEYEIALGPMKPDPGTGKPAPAKRQRLEGKVTTIEYRNPQGRSVLEISRNYEQALARAGFQIAFSCKGEECGADSPGEWHPVFRDPSYLRRYLAARLARPAGDVWVALAVQAQSADMQGDTQLDVIETKPMQAGLVTADFKALGDDLARTGHASVYGIYFDTGKAEVKPESASTLEAIAKLLAAQPRLALHVVGHTDSTGNFDSNLELSRARARAVVQALTSRHGIAAQRLRAHGVASLNPVASNDDEEGRARNRRVELVKQ